MKICIRTFSSELEKIREENEISKMGMTPGMYAFLNAGYSAASTEQIDWDSFTLEEAERVFEDVYYYQPAESVDANDSFANRNNVLHDYMECLDMIRGLRVSKFEARPDFVQFV